MRLRLWLEEEWPFAVDKDGLGFQANKTLGEVAQVAPSWCKPRCCGFPLSLTLLQTVVDLLLSVGFLAFLFFNPRMLPMDINLPLHLQSTIPPHVPFFDLRFPFLFLH